MAGRTYLACDKALQLPDLYPSQIEKMRELHALKGTAKVDD